MIYSVFAIRDQKSGRFMQPINDINEKVAQRGFAQAVNENNSIMGFAPKDFDLYKIAEFNDETGRYTPLECIDLIVNGSQLVNERIDNNEM